MLRMLFRLFGVGRTTPPVPEHTTPSSHSNHVTVEPLRRSSRLNHQKQSMPIFQLPMPICKLNAKELLHSWTSQASSISNSGIGSSIADDTENMIHSADNSSNCTNAVVSLGMLRPGQEQLEIKVPVAVMSIRRTSAFAHTVNVMYERRVLISVELTPHIPFQFMPHQHGLAWTMCVEQEMFGFYVRFAHEMEEANMAHAWSAAHLEVNRQERFDKIVRDDSDIRWIHRANQHLILSDSDMVTSVKQDDDEDDEDDDEEMPDYHTTAKISTRNSATEALSSDDEASSESSSVYDDEKEEDVRLGCSHTSKRSQRRTSLKATNNNLAVGMAVDRTFVSREAQLGVFRHDADGALQYLNAIPIVRDRTGAKLIPTKMMLHERDRKMLFLSQHDTTRVFEMDLERGAVTAEWGVSEDFHIGALNPVTKYAEQTSEGMVSAVNANSIFQMDPRQHSTSKLAQGKTYEGSSVPLFSTLATTDNGCTAAATHRGDIRLYNDVTRKAKTLLPGLGDPVIGLDTSANGHWILATTQYYLLLIPTNEGIGFKTSITGQADAPIKLQLSPHDIVNRNINSVHFTPARFDTSADHHAEQWVVTSTGRFIITWNLRDVIKRNRRFNYTIKVCEDKVVSNQFLFNQQDTVVVTLPNDLYTEKRTAVTRSNK